MMLEIKGFTDRYHNCNSTEPICYKVKKVLCSKHEFDRIN